MTTTERTTDEALAPRMWRQVQHGLDKDRLLGDVEKRRRDLAKKLDREMDRNGWRIFVAGQAHGIATAKGPGKRNAEAMLVETVQRWVRQVQELLPHRMKDLVNIVNEGLKNPAPLPRKEE